MLLMDVKKLIDLYKVEFDIGVYFLKVVKYFCIWKVQKIFKYYVDFYLYIFNVYRGFFYILLKSFRCIYFLFCFEVYINLKGCFWDFGEVGFVGVIVG